MNRSLEEINECNIEKHNLVGKRVLIEIETVSDKSEGGLLLGDEKYMKKLQSQVCVGNLIKCSKSFQEEIGEDLKAGDKIFFTSYAGRVLFSSDDKRYRSILFSEVIGYEKE